MELFENVNLKSALQKQEKVSGSSSAEKTLRAFKSLFEADWESDNRILITLTSVSKTGVLNCEQNLDQQNIYRIETIRSLSLKFRLRFLPSHYFKAEIPLDALRAIKLLERDLSTKIESYYILAPAKLFQLEDANQDPLLFIPLSDGTFYLLHKWGNDLAWHRRITAWPLRSLTTLVASTVIFSSSLALTAPEYFLRAPGAYFSIYRFILFIYLLLSTSAILSYFWFATNQQLSSQAWNSKTFN